MCYILVYTLNIVLKISQHKKSKILSKFDIVINNRFQYSLFPFTSIPLHLSLLALSFGEC
jgi:presenilin-like A22 family membrane protease